MKILIALASLFFALPTYAQNFKGYDILGLARQDVRMISQEIRPSSVIGVLDGTFGNVIPALETLIGTGKVVAIRAHLRDGTCWRNKVCPKGTPSLHDLRELGKRARRYQALVDRTGVPCYLSPVLEHDERDRREVEAWISTIRTNAPSCVPVISAFRGIFLPDILKERHGNSVTADIVSNDGVSLYDADTRTFWRNASGFSLAWINRFNGRYTGEKTFTPPLQRKIKATRRDMRTINRLMETPPGKPGTPAACREVREVEHPNRWKSNAEDYALKERGLPDDGRGNKIVFLVKNKGRFFDILRSDGKKIACLKRFDPPLDGFDRFYLGSCSGLDNLQLMDAAGSEWVFAKSGSTCYLGNAIRRLGSFR